MPTAIVAFYPGLNLFAGYLFYDGEIPTSGVLLHVCSMSLGRDRLKTIASSSPRESSCRARLYCAQFIAWGRENAMSDSVYKVIEVVGTSSKSWEAAAAAAVERASQSLRDLRVAEVTEQDVQIEDGKIKLYRTKLKLSFKFEGSI
jgi:dodecin